MRHYCMRRDETVLFLHAEAGQTQIEDGPLGDLVDAARNWEIELSCLTYLFSMILDMDYDGDDDRRATTDLLYRQEERMSFVVQELGTDFIDCLLRNLRDPALSLEDALIDCQNRLGEHDYDKTLRY